MKFENKKNICCPESFKYWAFFSDTLTYCVHDLKRILSDTQTAIMKQKIKKKLENDT
jgi:hypothetical protein